MRGEVASVKWELVGDHSGVLVATDDIRISEPKKLGKYEQPFMDAIPEDGISRERHRDIWTQRGIKRQEYHRAKNSLLRDSQIKEEDGVLFRLIPTQ